MTAQLRFEQGGHAQSVECRGITTIGRDKGNDIVVADRLVSRNHAIVRRLGKSDYYLIDSGSANGSYLNGRRISMPTPLRHRDQIAIGSATFTFDQDDTVYSTTAQTTDTESTLVSAQVRIQQICILVADIRGFTSLSETIPIQTLTKIMSEWFQSVSAGIQASDGVVEKFIGDCVYARWDVSGDPDSHVYNALRSALEIFRITDAFNTVYPDLPQALRIGVGINIGQAAINVGQDFAAVGDAVNTTFRLESATKELGCDIVLGQDAYRHLPPPFTDPRVRTVAVKGKREPLHVCGMTFDEAQSLPSLDARASSN
jgi:adenylate cyclase